jgi:adenylate cyclase
VHSPLKRKVRLVLLITGFWLLVALFMWVVDILFVASLPQVALTPETVRITFETTMLGGLLGGLLGGSGIVFFLKDRIRHLPLAAVLGLHTATYILSIIVVASVVSAVFHAREHSVALWRPEVFLSVVDFLASPAFVRVLLLWAATAGFTSVLLEVNDKYGPGVFRDFLLGRYHRPKVEQRFFLFLDLRGSTTIAERLGHIEYFDFLGRFIADATDPILAREGQIHEYVGDEIVVSWKAEDGAHDANCVACFFAIRDAFAARADAYRHRFGLVPDFKASVHFGPVTVGEIGVVKKEIVFSGDVLNTTARIQERCNVLGVDLLVSGDALDHLDREVSAVPVEEIELRGKAVPVTLFTVDEPPLAAGDRDRAAH